MNKRLVDFLYVALILIVISFIIWVFFFLRSNSAKCMQNPFIYGASKLENAQCSCTEQGNMFGFSFNSTDFWNNEEKMSREGNFTINFSDFKSN
jgi:hypothetical protein